MHVEEGFELGRRAQGYMLPKAGEFRARRDDGGVEARLFLGDTRRRNVVVRDLELRMRYQLRMPDCDAARHADAVDGETHSPSPNFSLINPTSAAMAWASSGPSVSIAMTEPFAAASIMTPMMLLALTLRLSRVIHTSAVNWPAICVSLADARACRPSLFMISISRCCISHLRYRHLHDAFDAAGDGLGHDGFQRFVAIGQCAHQHGQVHARHAFDLAGDEQPARDIARGGTVDV